MIFYLTLAPFFLLAQAHSIDIGIFNVPAGSNTFEVRIKPNQAISNYYSGGVFTVHFPASYGVTLSVVSSPYSYALQPTGSQGGIVYYPFAMAVNQFVNWPANQEVLIATLKHSNNGTGIGTFDITNDGWTASHLANFYQELNFSSAQNIFYSPQTSAPLPVNLTDFQAKAMSNRTVSLDWASETEVGLNHYAIEHSMDGIKFTEIGKVQPQGGPLQAATYNFIHLNPQAGKNYYRLRMVDHSPTFQYSPIRTAEIEGKRSNFSLQPTPTTGPLYLMSTNLDQYPAGLKYQLTDNMGKLLQTDLIINERTDFNLAHYAAGIYYLTVFTDQEQVKQFKVVVTKN